MDIATLGVRVESNGVVVANDRLKGFQGEAAKSEASANRLSASVRRLGTSLLAGFAAGFSIRAVVSTLSDFEQSMSAVQAVMRPTAVELDAVREKVKELGGTTEFTASQVADGFKFMGLAGWDAAQSIEAMPAVLNLATAASMDLARAADISSNIMSAFGIQASEAAIVADTLAVANANANTSVEQLGDGMKYAGPVAQAFGISVGDTAAAIGTLSDAGIQGSMAGTSLRRVMSSLANATPAATRALAGMGLTLAELNPATNDLVDIVDKLAEAGLSAEAAFTIFGDRGAPAILALVENNAKLRELTGLLDDATGAASEMADVMRDNLWGDIKNVQAAVESIIIALGESGLTNVLRAALQGLTAVFRTIADQMDRLVTYLGVAAVGAAWAFRGAMVTATGAVWSFVASLGGLRAILMRLGLPALILLAGELVYQFTRLVEKTGGWGHALDALGNLASGVWEGITTSAKAIPPALQAVWLDMQAQFYLALAQMKAAWNDFISIFEQPALVVTIGGKAHELIGGLDLSAWKYDLDSAGDAAGRLQGRANELRQTAGALAAEGFDQVTEAAKRFADTMTRSTWLDTDLGPDNISTEWSRFNAIAGSGGGGGGGTGAAGGATAQLNAYQEATKAVLDNIAALEQQGLTFGMTETAASRFNTAMELLSAAQEAGMPITAELIEEINALAGAYAQAEEQARQLEAAAALFDVPDDPFAVLKEHLAGLDTMLARGQISWEQYGMAAFRANSMAASSVLGLASGMTGALAQMFQDNKAFAVANAVVSTAEAVMKALSIYGPTPWGFAAAGVAAATGAAQISAILSAQKGSASAPRVSSGAATAPAAAETQRTTQISVTLQGSGRYSREDLEDMFSQITDGLNNGVDGSERFKVAVAS